MSTETKVTNINFMGQRHMAMALSIFLILGSFAGLWMKGLNFGIDFTGGTIIELSYPTPVDLTQLRKDLTEAEYGEAVAQHFGSAEDVLIRIAPREGMNSAQLSNQVMDALNAATEEEITLRRVEFVGPQVGDELTEDGALAVLYALFGILIYVALRFEWRFSVGSVAALVHDVIITVGVFAWTQMQFDLTVLAAILAVIGYSLNDTIVVFDRVRENFRTMRDGTPVEVTNVAVNQMLSRTIMTSLTTLIVLLALFFLGGEIIHGFAAALIVGVVVGTFSSTYVASAVALLLGVSKEDLMKAPTAELDREAQEAELQRAFLESEAKREAKLAKQGKKIDEDEDEK
ncbi:protein translocase subunit SecF [Thiomicrorhabdus lithotrophica]|uniref:Protein-export membrane protein SecF n=1 Tax=Thiomicrorhabdus lithotrophica TaxID=2949997 RepID=A0ABY8CB68_9GAMM|nr:protein translocase subunit SecF [Thiomicrorhabdus lithotrophica]WEJ63184.1 protein translocase subunit SecF [Thiomicrorhabdus lithotrophica]